MGCGLSLKVHMMRAHLDKFKNNMKGVFIRARRYFYCFIIKRNMKITDFKEYRINAFLDTKANFLENG